MATLSHPLPSLEITAAADDMEISSELGRFDNDNDIDIDFDLTADHLGDPDGDYMLEDIKSEAGEAASVQDQDMNQEGVVFDEQDHILGNNSMEEDAALRDEHLTDASVEDRPDTSITDLNEEPAELLDFNDDIDLSATEKPQEDSSRAAGLNYEQTVNQPATPSDDRTTSVDGVHVRDFSASEKVTETNRLANGSASIQHEQNETHENSLPTTQEHSIDERDHQNPEDVLPEEKYTDDARRTSHSPHDVRSPTIDKHGAQSHTRAELPAQGQSEHDDFDEHNVHAESSDNSTYHSIIVVYDGAEISLFPPREQDESQTYFLQDASLISRSIGDLLQACRNVLGATITEEQELQLEVHDLDLTIGEESAHAFSTSFSELLEVYLSLHSVDGTAHPEPFYVTLTTKTRFSARLSFLRAAIADGRGMSELWYADVDADADGEEYSEEQADVSGGQKDTQESTEQVNQRQVDPDILTGNAENPGSGHVDSLAPVSADTLDAQSSGTGFVETFYKGEGSHMDAGQAVRSSQEPNKPDSVGHAEDDVKPEIFESNIPSRVSAVENASTERTVDGGRNANSDFDVSQGEDALIDFSDEDEGEIENNNSSGSSTAVGDGPTAQEDGKIQDATAPEQYTNSTNEAESSTSNQYNAGETNQPELFHELEEDNCSFEQQDDFSAAFDEDSYGLETREDEEHSQVHEAADEVAGDQINLETEQQATFDDPQNETNEQEEIWSDFLDPEQPLEEEGEQPVEWGANDSNIAVQPDFAVSTETLVGGAENDEEQHDQQDAIVIDDFDEITYEEEDEDSSGREPGADEAHAASGRPSDSPPGKRSFTEHLEGELEDQSELESKRLRST